MSEPASAGRIHIFFGRGQIVDAFRALRTYYNQTIGSVLVPQFLFDQRARRGESLSVSEPKILVG